MLQLIFQEVQYCYHYCMDLPPIGKLHKSDMYMYRHCNINQWRLFIKCSVSSRYNTSFCYRTYAVFV